MWGADAKVLASVRAEALDVCGKAGNPDCETIVTWSNSSPSVGRVVVGAVRPYVLISLLARWCTDCFRLALPGLLIRRSAGHDSSMRCGCAEGFGRSGGGAGDDGRAMHCMAVCAGQVGIA